MERKKTGLWVLTVLAAAPFAWGQGQGEVALGGYWLWQRGSTDSFRSQFNLKEGLFLQGLRLQLQPGGQGERRLQLQAEGFGALPYGQLRVLGEGKGSWRWELGYQQRERFFSWPSWDWGQRQERWRWRRWNARVAYEGFSSLRVEGLLAHQRRTGMLAAPFYGLGRAYVSREAVDESLSEASVVLSTRGWPLELVVEQGFQRQRWQSRPLVANQGQPAEGSDPDGLRAMGKPQQDERTTPITRLALRYEQGPWKVDLQGLYQKDNGESNRLDREMYGLDGGRQGTLAFEDRLLGRAETTTGAWRSRVGFAFSPQLALRLVGERMARSYDTRVSGERVLELVGPGGQLRLPLSVDQRGVLHVSDSAGGLELAWQQQGVSLTGFWRHQREEASWRQDQGQPRQGGDRTTDRWGFSAAWNGAGAVSSSLSFEHGNFSRAIFRVDPRVVTRASGKLRWRLAPSWQLEASASGEKEENKPEQADLSYRTRELSLACAYLPSSGVRAGLSWSQLYVNSEVGLSFFAPQPRVGLSSYHRRMELASAQLFLPLTPQWQVETSASWLSDHGRTAPFRAHNLSAALSFQASQQLALRLEGWQYRYDEKRINERDVRVRRFGLVMSWRF